MTHTPGPWEVWADFNVKGASGFVATCGSQRVNSDGGTAENRANAVLIASAPEMLDSLEQMVKTFGGWGDTDGPAVSLAKRIIAKAKGITP